MHWQNYQHYRLLKVMKQKDLICFYIVIVMGLKCISIGLSKRIAKENYCIMYYTCPKNTKLSKKGFINI
jgi:hypothetical protein